MMRRIWGLSQTRRVRALAVGVALALLAGGASAAAAASLSVNGTVTGVASLNVLTVPAAVMAVSNNDQTIYVADGYAHQVLALAVATDKVTVFAGNGSLGDSGDGSAAPSGELADPTALNVDKWGDVVIQDSQVNVYRVVAEQSCSGTCPYGLPAMVTGDIYTIVGGTGGSSTFMRPANGSVARSTLIEQLFGGAWTGTDQFGDLLFPSGSDNRDVFIVAGESCPSGSLTSCPYGFSSMTAGDLYWVAGNDFAGNPSAGNSGNGGPAIDAAFETPVGLAADAQHDILIADANTMEVRLVAGYSCSSSCPFGLPSMTAGDVYSLAAAPDSPEQLYLDPSGNLIVADPLNFNIDLIAAANCSSACPYGFSSLTAGQLYVLEGAGASAASVHGPLARAASGTIGQPAGLTLDRSANLFIEDQSTSELDEVQMVAPQSAAPPPPPPSTPVIAIGATHIARSHKKAAVTLSCTVAACSGEVELTASFKVKVVVKATSVAASTELKTFVLGKASYSIAAGAGTTVSLKLSSLARSALRKASRHKPLHATVSATLTGGTTVTKSVRFT